MAKARALGLREFVMPILYVKPLGIDDSVDAVATAVRDSQWVDWGELRYLDRTDGQYRKAIDGLVTRLQRARDASDAAESGGSKSHQGAGDQTSDESDLLEVAERATSLMEELEAQAPVLVARLGDLGEAFEAVGPILERAGNSSSPKQIRSALRMITAAQNPDLRAVLGGMDEMLVSIGEIGDLDLDLEEARKVQTTVRQLALVARGPWYAAGRSCDRLNRSGSP